MDVRTKRNRLCSLCQQCYGSGLRNHVAASDILRSRRMLLERWSAAEDGVREGLGMFLDDIAHQRQSTDLKHQHILSVCAFCVQFLPPMYQEDKLVDDLRHQLLAAGATHGHQIATSRRKASNLVIQHHLRNSSPRSQTLAAAVTARSPQTYRLLTDEMTRVLQLDASAVHSSFGGQTKLMTGDTITDLRTRERQQSVNLIAIRQTARDLRLVAAQQSHHVRSEDQSLSSDIHQAKTEKKNFVRVGASNSTGASSLYTGVLVHPPSQRSHGDVATKASQAKVVQAKNGRLFKTELRFPSVSQ